MKEPRRLNTGQRSLVTAYKWMGIAVEALVKAEAELARQSAATWAEEICLEVKENLERLRKLREKALLVADVYPSEVS